MLKLFKVRNFKGFKDELVFDLSKTKEYEFNKEVIKNGISNKAIIYGKNGSGKTNLGLGIFDIVSTLTDNNKSILRSKSYSNANNLKDELTEFFYEFQFEKNKAVYTYSKKSLENIICEKLVINDETVLFYDKQENNTPIINLDGAKTLNININDLKISLLKYVNSNTILDTNETNQTFKKLMMFVEKMLFFRSLTNNNYIGFKNGSENIIENIIENGNLKELEKFFNEAEIDCKLIEIESDGKKGLAFDFMTHSISFRDIASSGTESLLLLFYWMQTIGNASFVFVDEFDAFYHYKLSKLIVKKLKEKDAQIILTTHNTSIMSNDLFRPDCYFNLMKIKISPLFELTSKDLRKANNLEKLYKSGAFNG